MMRINNFNLSPLEVLFLFSGYMTHLNITFYRNVEPQNWKNLGAKSIPFLPNFQIKKWRFRVVKRFGLRHLNNV